MISYSSFESEVSTSDKMNEYWILRSSITKLAMAVQKVELRQVQVFFIVQHSKLRNLDEEQDNSILLLGLMHWL